jgi:hypothetical protein
VVLGVPEAGVTECVDMTGKRERVVESVRGCETGWYRGLV